MKQNGGSMCVLSTSLFTCLKFFISAVDGQYETLKAVFLASGKGRWSNLPCDIQMDNRLLIQLFFLREEGDKSWREVSMLYVRRHLLTCSPIPHMNFSQKFLVMNNFFADFFLSAY